MHLDEHHAVVGLAFLSLLAVAIGLLVMSGALWQEGVAWTQVQAHMLWTSRHLGAGPRWHVLMIRGRCRGQSCRS